jgi:hypothetical protein
MKQCSTCGKSQPLREFSKDRCCKDGYRNTCKICVAAYMAAYYRRPNVRAHKKAYDRTYDKAYNQRPEIKAKQNKCNRLRIYWCGLWVKTILTDGKMLCSQCGKPEIGQMLSCHHKNGDGQEHRKSCNGANTPKYWRSILESGCDPKLYQALCKSCHSKETK